MKLMTCHIVRQLTVCDACDGLINKAALVKGYGAELCQVCAIRRAGGLAAFMKMYPNPEVWRKLTLGTVGVEGMRKLLTALIKAEGSRS